jgi:glycosyltransferase involved in cell wall biosynthesis
MRSIIIPTYNHVENCLKPCLKSILNQGLKDAEVFVVANGCRDGTEDYVKSLGTPVRLISSPDPLGYTRAVNVGISAAAGDMIVLINDDCQILDWGRDSWLDLLEAPMAADPKVAATGSSKDVWAMGRPFLVFDLVMIRKKTLVEFGLLDDVFNPGCGEDTDFCLKAQAKGMSVLQVPRDFDHWRTEFPIWHIGHATCAGIPDWENNARRNLAILESRYPRSQADRDYQKAFSEGLQNIHLWNKK